MVTTFYVTDTPGPAILGLASYSRLRIVHLNCSVQLRKHGQPIKTCKEREKVKQDMKNLKPINSKNYLIKAYADQFEGIGKFPPFLPHISQKGCHTCCAHTLEMPNNHKPLVDKKLDKQEVIVPVTEPTNWVSSLTYLWKPDGDLRTCLNSTNLKKAIRQVHYRIPMPEEITKADGSSSYYCIIPNYESSLLTTFNTHRRRFHFVHLPFRLTCAKDVQRMMDQILDNC